jgi:4-diphosphocytidyl-2-C-methyl-D-erythritol kinase
MRNDAARVFRAEKEEIMTDENIKDAATNMTQTAIDEQKIDDFNELGWVKVLAPAKVNLHLAIGSRRADGYHEAVSVMHALALHDTVYLRRDDLAQGEGLQVSADMVGRGGVQVPQLDLEDNIAVKAVRRLGKLTGHETGGVQIRIEKNIPFQAGLGGGSSDAAAALVGAANLWDIDPHDAALEQAARELGSDVAFFLQGGCGRYTGTGSTFAGGLTPQRSMIVLVKPASGVSTAEAYRTFDAAPEAVAPEVEEAARTAANASDIALYNNLAPAAERLLPELADIRTWLLTCEGVSDALLCGSGSTTFAVVDTLEHGLAAVTEARRRGWWARTSSFSPLGAVVVPDK